MVVGDEVVFRQAGDELGHGGLGIEAADPGTATESTRASAARSRSVNASLVS